MPEFFPSLRGRVQTKAIAFDTEQKAIAFSRFYQDTRIAALRRPGANYWSVQRAVVEGFDRVVWVFKSVTTIASDSAGLPYRLRDGDDEVDDHPLYRVLNGKANDLESGYVLRQRLSAQILLSPHGAFVQKVKSNGGTIKHLHLLPPDRTKIIPGLDGSIECFEMTRHNGGGVRQFGPDEVLWFRSPHPTEPYEGVTPLGSMGLSVELDHFARLYNVSFMQNDGRPGGVLAVRDTNGSTGAVSDTEMNRIESRFGKGPVEAGKLSVIAGELSYVDLATRPRDMQYGQTSANAKSEILAGFGMSEVVLGTAAGRTFDNADAELYNYWTRTIPAHNKILLDGFDEDAGDDLVGYFDTSEVEVLERQARRQREEWRTEHAAGLRSTKSYADKAGYGDEIEDTVFTRSLYIANGKTPIPTRSDDIATLGLDTGAAAGPPSPTAAPGVDAEAMPEEPIVDTEVPGSTGEPFEPVEPDAAAMPPGVDMSALGMKQLHLVPGGGAHPKVRFALAAKDVAGWQEDDDAGAAQQRLEAELTAVLSALTERWVERAVARVQSPRQRKGTRHWQPEYERDTRLGTKALDAAKAVDVDGWQEEAEEQVSPIVQAAAVAAAVALLTGVGFDPPTGQSVRDVAVRVTRRLVTDTVRLVGRSAARQARLLVERVNSLDQAGQRLDDIVAAMRQHASRVRDWAEGVSVVSATGTVNGARDAAAEEASDSPNLTIRREWVTRLDAKVRDAHRLAHGQVRSLREPFLIDGSLLRFPGDPLAPVHLTANCRCRLRYRHRITGVFVSMPGDAVALSGA